MRRLLENRIALYVTVAFVAVGVAGALILVNVVGSDDDKQAAPTTTAVAPRVQSTSGPAVTETTPTARVTGAAATAKLLRGIPQTLNALGAFIDPDSETALRATYAAALQGKFWNVLDLLYRNQGAENSGWVTDGLLRAVGASIPGFDTKAMMAARTSPDVDNALALSRQQAQSAKVTSTPTFFAGKTGGTLEHISVDSLTADAFTPALDALTK